MSIQSTKRIGAGLWFALCLAGCGTVTVSGDPDLDQSLLATISGDYKLRATSPVNVYLRKVDDETIGTFSYSARVAPGPHELLVDCSVGNPDNLTRYVIDVDVTAGVRYRLQAVLSPGNRECTAVRLIEDRPPSS